jgi:general nucleoside transport system permease protein
VSGVTTATVEERAEAVVAKEPFWVRQRRLGAGIAVIGLIAAVVFGPLAESKTAKFTLSENASGAALKINGQLGTILFGIITIAIGIVMLTGRVKRRWNALLVLGIVTFVISFLCWQVAGQFLPIAATARFSLELALPLILGALAGVLGERSGVVNVGIEAQFLTGAFCAALFGTLATSLWAGVISAMLGGVLIAALLAVLAIKYLVDQVVVGVVLNLFAAGITGFLYDRLMQPNAAKYNQPPHLTDIKVPGLSSIPVIGPVLFHTNVLVWFALILVFVVHFALKRTRWGLRTRAVGEHPVAADTVGVRVRGLRYTNVLIGGLIAGAGGSYFTLISSDAFTGGMTGGLGYIALAALIFGRWTPFGALGAALFFGFTQELANYLGAIGSPVPNQFLNMLPYLATIVAVAGLVGRVRAPKADGVPYVKS